MKDLNLLTIDENENLFLDGQQLKNVVAFGTQDEDGATTLAITMRVGNGNLPSRPRKTTKEILEDQLDELVARSHQCSDADLHNITRSIVAVCGVLAML